MLPYYLIREMHTCRVNSAALKQMNRTGINVLVCSRKLQNGSTAWRAVTRY